MKLKRVYDTKDEIPKEYLALYEERDGKFHLKIEFEGLAPKEKVDEFRDNNVKLTKELEDLKKQYGDVTPERLKQIQKEAQDAKDAARKKEEEAAIKEGKIDQVLASRTSEMKTGYEKQIAELNEQVRKGSAELERIIVERGIAEAAAKKKVLPTAVEDVIMRGKMVWKLKDGVPQPFEIKEGKEELRYGKDGKVLTFETWLDSLATSAPHLFEASAGSGASGKGGGATGAAANPWKKETFNLTQQGVIFRNNPEQARKLAAEAGAKI
jgi:hypothetical protein